MLRNVYRLAENKTKELLSSGPGKGKHCEWLHSSQISKLGGALNLRHTDN